MKTKAFDCVAMKQEAAARIHEEIGTLPLDKKIEYWRAKSREFRAEQGERSASGSDESPGAPSDRQDPS